MKYQLMGFLFTEWLIDPDPCLNPGNWMCTHGRIKGHTFDPLIGLSCSAFFSQHCEISASGNCSADLLILGPDRIYRVVSFPEK